MSSPFDPTAVGQTAVAAPAAPASVYTGTTGTFTPPAGTSTAGQQQSGSGSFMPSKLPSSIIQGVDKFGGGIGFASPVTTGGMTGTAGVTVPGSFSPGAVSAAPLSGVLTGAGIGGLVGAINPLAHGSVQGQVGGALGGAAAAALGFTGPVGMIAGGLLGSSIGGIFGKKKPGVHLSEFQTGVWNGNDFSSGTGFTNKRADQSQAQELHTDFSGYLNDVATKYGLDFSGTAFRGGFNDRDQGGWFIGAKKDNSKGDPAVDPDAWLHLKIDPKSPDKYKAYAQVAGQMLASQGRMSQDIANQLIKDTQERLNKERIGGVGLGGSEPIIPNASPSGKESFGDFLSRYRAGDLDKGPVTAARNVEPKMNPISGSNMGNIPSTGTTPKNLVAADGKDYSPKGTPDDQKWKYNVGPQGPNGTPMGYM